ncbi:Orf y [Tanacetum coccineum]
MLVLPADPGLWSEVISRWESITIIRLNNQTWSDNKTKLAFVENLLGESEKLMWQQWRTVFPEAYSALEAIADEPQNITSHVRQLIMLEDPYRGSTDEQDRAYRDLDRITCEETKNLWSFLEDFRQLATKSGRLYFPSTTEKLFAKLPPSISKKIEESFRTFHDYCLQELKLNRPIPLCPEARRARIPGLDGFNFAFITKSWDVIKDDFWNCIRHFESTGGLCNGCNPSFIVLVPKKKDPLGFSDYRPISLIGCVYKVISKMLASRLAKVIGSVIGPNQLASIEGRHILDGYLVANEIIRMAALENHKLLLFKVDFEKAFDSVN